MVEFNIDDPNNYITPFIDVLPNKRYKQPKSIKGFTVVDEDGNRYVFGGGRNQNASEYSIDLRQDNDGAVNGSANGEMYADSWYLTAVYDRFGIKIYDFKYKRGLFVITPSMCFSQTLPKMMINSPVYLDKITTYDGTSLEFIQDGMILTSTDFYYRLYYGKSLSSMYKDLSACQIGSNWSHAFIYLSDSDYSMYQNPNNTNKEEDPLKSMGLSPLKEIRIKKHDALCQSYIFAYDFGNNVRLHLKRVEIHDKDGMTDGVYKFKYNQFDKLPTIGGHCDYLTTSSDDWGYYNGLTGNKKDVSPTCSQLGMLTEIQYPTGGVTTIEYVNHWYNSVRNSFHDGMETVSYLYPKLGKDRLMAGGLCVKRIVNYEDSNKSKILSEHSFDYYDGQLATLPGTLYVSDNYATGGFIPYLPLPMANIFGSYIGYSKVLETICGRYEDSQRLYEYSNFSSYREESCWKSLASLKNNYSDAARINAMMAGYDEWTQREYMRGRLLHYAIRSDDDCEWYSVSYTYRTDSVDRESNYVTGYMDKSKTNYCESSPDVGHPVSYRLFYPKYDVVRKTEKTLYHWTDKYVEDVTTYSMSDHVVNLSNGYIHKGELRLCDSETRSRSGNAVRFDYQYLLNGYFAPVVSKKEYRNGTFVKGRQTEYGNFYINKRTVRLPKKEKELYPSQETVTLKYYTKYSNAYLPTVYKDNLNRTVRLQWNSDDQLLSYTIGNQTTFCEYNNLGLVSGIVQPNGYELDYEYDAMQRLNAIKDKNGSYRNKYKYEYRTTNNHE